MKNKFFIPDTTEAFQDLSHGEIITKFIAKDEGKIEGDISVELHGFVTDSGDFIITSQRVCEP